MYETKIVVSPARAWERATPAQRRTWFPDGPPAGPANAAPAGYGAGASWDADPAAVAKATRAGMAALAAGYGEVLADGMAPCATCPACQYGRPQDCRRPRSKAQARLLAGPDRARTLAMVAELGALYVELSAGLD